MYIVTSSVGITTGWTVEVQLPARAGDFSLDVVQTGSAAHAVFNPMSTRGLFPWG
jgi:hypothetical protein